jgi:phosphoglycerate dehydrogenase-like enzyme
MGEAAASTQRNVYNPAATNPLAELDRLLPLCDTVLISSGLGPGTRGLIDTRRLALMKPGALLINRSGLLPVLRPPSIK